MEIVQGVHRVEGTVGGNVYLLEGRGLTLIDCGLPGNLRPIVRYIRAMGRDPRELEYILFTHGHPDHTGTAMALRKITGARLAVHPGDARMDGKGRRWVYYPGQLFTLSWHIPFAQRVAADYLVRDNEVLPVLGGLRVLHTPGHTPGSITLLLEEHGVLFTGDTLLSNGARFGRPFPFPGHNEELYLRSLERLAALQFQVACGGHGRPLMADASQKLQEGLNTYLTLNYWDGLAYKLGLLPKARRPMARSEKVQIDMRQ